VQLVPRGSLPVAVAKKLSVRFFMGVRILRLRIALSIRIAKVFFVYYLTTDFVESAYHGFRLIRLDFRISDSIESKECLFYVVTGIRRDDSMNDFAKLLFHVR